MATIAVNGRRIQYSGDALEYAKRYADNHPSDWVVVRVNGVVVYRRCDEAGCLEEQ